MSHWQVGGGLLGYNRDYGEDVEDEADDPRTLIELDCHDLISDLRWIPRRGSRGRDVIPHSSIQGRNVEVWHLVH